MRFRASWIAACFVATLGFAPAAAEEEAVPYDVLSYRLAIAIDFAENPGPESPYRSFFSVLNTLSGEATIRLRNVSARAQEEISLILHRLMKASEIKAGGRALSFDQELRGLEGWENFHVLHVRARWAEPVAPGEEAALSVRYAGQLVGYPEVGMLYVRETLDPDFTILRSETFSYPQVSRPKRDAVRSARRRDEFDQELKVTVPVGHVVVSGARSTAVESEDGKTTYSFSSYEPASQIILPIAPYEVTATGPHRIFYFRESSKGVEKLVESLDRVMALFSSWFGPPLVERGLTIAEIPEFFGSQAGPLILQTSGAFTNPEQRGEFYHELSHLWNPPDIDPKPSRWNEGLAMFLQGLAEEKLERQDNLHKLLSDIFSRMKGRLDSDDKLTTVAMADYGKEEMTSYSYSTGALFFGLLHHRVGEAALLGFVRDYSRQHRGPGSTDQGFAAEIVSSLGQETRDIVQEWFLTTAFVPRLTAAESWDDLKQAYR